MEKKIVKVREEDVSKRIDMVISEHLGDISRTKAKNLIDDELVTANGVFVKPNHKCKTGELIEITILPEESEVDIVAVKMKLNIVYQDRHVAVVYKPSGMVVHPAKGHYNDTLVNGLMYSINKLSDVNGVVRPGIVHRIDKDTSGLLMIAKNNKAHAALAEQLKNKTVTRKYVALVDGVIPHDQGKVNAPIGRSKNDRKKMDVVEKGKESITHFTVLERFNKHTLIECVLETGRTHQIRVHMNYIGFPVYGDPLYGRKKTDTTNGQLLHAKTIGFTHPSSKKYLEFSIEEPSYFIDKIEELRADGIRTNS